MATSSDIICFMDKILDFAKMNDFEIWLNENEYTSECILIDLFSSNEHESNMEKLFWKHKDIHHSIRQYARKIACFNEVKVIGISGATRSGKGTLAGRIQKCIGFDKCAVIDQDDYFDFHKIQSELNHNWDCPRAIDFTRQYCDLRRKITHYKNQLVPINRSTSYINEYFYIICEGFMLFYDEKVTKCMDFYIWIDISRQLCYDRRMATKGVSEEYFDKKLWPNYSNYREMVFQKEIKDQMLILDGSLDRNSEEYRQSLPTVLQLVTT